MSTNVDAISLREAALYVRAAAEELARARNTLAEGGVLVTEVRFEVDEAETAIRRLARFIEGAS